jgi:hypothetical protein
MHGAFTQKSTTGFATLPPTVQTSRHCPKSDFSNEPPVDHLPLASVDAITGPQSVLDILVVRTLIV